MPFSFTTNNQAKLIIMTMLVFMLILALSQVATIITMLSIPLIIVMPYNL